MKAKIIKYLKEIILFILLLSIASNVLSLYKSRSLNHEPLQISAVHLIDNQTYTFPNAKPVLIHFWATWCPTCKLEASNIELLSKYFEVVTVAVKSGNDDEIKAWLDENGYSYNVVNDSDALLASKFNLNVFPTTFIYDKDGNLAFSEVGYTSTLGLWLRMIWAGY